MERDRSRACHTLAISNEQAYDIYRRSVGADLARPTSLIDTGPEWSWHTQIVAQWMNRYTRRRTAIAGEHGDGHRLADAAALEVLVARNLAREAEFPEPPDWDEMTRYIVGMSLENAYRQRSLDVSSLGEPCRFGPSLRRLWAEARSRGLTEAQAWQAISAWACCRPPAWDRDAKSKRPGAPPEASPGSRLECPATWQKTGDLDLPWLAEVGGERWQVRINDFPDEHMYTLLVNGEPAGNFDNWPGAWDRGDRPPATSQPKPAAVLAVKGRFLERYQAGEHEAVWAEMVALGPDVRKPQYHAETVAVARETMRRARHNVELLIRRLDGLGYRFGWPAGRARDHLRDTNVFLPPAPDEKAQLDEWEHQGLVLPLSLRLWIEEVGRVDLTGSHPALCFLENDDSFPGVYADPLMVIPTADSLEDMLGLGEGEDDMFLSHDDWGKAAIGRNEQIDSAYSMEVPNLAADGLLRGERRGICFVEYLRLSFRWGGFPGWEGQARRPERELAVLTQDLLPL